jgi:hypothetical protein
MANLSTFSYAVQEIVSSEIVRAGYFTYDNSDRGSFFSLFGPAQTSMGSEAYNWTLQNDGLTAYTRVEGDPHSAVNDMGFNRPTLSYRLYDQSFRVTSHLKAALKGGSAAHFDAVARLVDESIRAIYDAVHTQWIGSSGEGIALAIDATNTYAGLAHNTTTGWASTDTTHSAALSLALLENTHETLRDNDVRANLSDGIILFPENQVTNYIRLQGPGVRYGMNINVAAGQSPNIDLGSNVSNASFMGMPIIGMPDQTNTIMFMLPRSTCAVINHEREPGDGGWAQGPSQPDTAHSEDWNISYFGLFVVHNPEVCATATGITA